MILKNVLVDSARMGLALWNSSTASMVNATITGCEEQGIQVRDTSSAQVLNSILWNNAADIYADLIDSVNVSFSDVENGWEGPGNAIFNLDPLFVDTAAADFHLQQASPCVDAGAPWSDYSSEPDYNGRRVNLGVFGGSFMASASNPEIDAPEEMSFYGTELETSDTLQLSILNTGTSYLNVDTLFMDTIFFHPSFSLENDGFRIEPEGERFVGITFTPQDTNEVNAVVVIRTNDEDEGEIYISLTGQGYHEVPTAPTGLAADPWDGEVTLFWDQYEDTTIAAFNIWRGLSDSTISILDEIAPEATSYTDTTVTNGETYIYVLTAKDSLGYESGYSNSISVTPLGPALSVAPDSLFFDLDLDTLQLEIVNEGYGDFMWNVTDAPEWVTVVPDSSGAGQIEGQAFSLFGKSSSFAQRTSSLSIKPTTHKIPTSKSDIPRDFISTNSRVSVSDTVLVIVDRTDLEHGMYYGDIHIASNGGDRTVAVEMEVPEVPTAPTGLAADPWDGEVTLFWDQYEDTTIAAFNIWRGLSDSTINILDEIAPEA
ncbi:MAG: hypothetical protein QGH61_10380, partial [Candidatus Marinimicrobia bacterium]|nr:hypothetical protein [Candidatus Neomarinimicrobiota bacterium]